MPLRALRAGITFLTRIPVGGFPYHADDWRWASGHFPLIGALLGAALAGVWCATASLGAMPAAALVLAVSLLATGAFHEDGLADTADALGGAYDRARVLEILKDSRIGAFGGAALAMTLLTRFALLAALGDRAPLALVISEGVSRLPPVVLMAILPYATDDARAKSRQITRARGPQVALAGGWTAAILVGAIAWGGLTPLTATAILAAITAAGAIAGWRFVRRVGGVTGDFLGATQQVAVVAALIALRAA
ncbi:MAG: adenosylcobinamide-GDP ribazoletransferase [Deltaproteobacteria bacterium]|nr:adenosylcobinamide-GDP ribazoletransferase [Deltaproteobacteria bacterium]